MSTRSDCKAVLSFSAPVCCAPVWGELVWGELVWGELVCESHPQLIKASRVASPRRVDFPQANWNTRFIDRLSVPQPQIVTAAQQGPPQLQRAALRNSRPLGPLSVLLALVSHHTVSPDHEPVRCRI
jgi:hypothetical protein